MFYWQVNINDFDGFKVYFIHREQVSLLPKHNGISFFAPPPGALGRGQRVKYHLISITKSISKIFIPNFVCVLKNEDTKHIRQDFHSVA